MKALILGGSGQLARSIGPLVENPIFASRTSDTKLDLTQNETIYDRISKIEPDLIMNASGMTNVDGCEQNKREAYLINALAIREIARYSRIHKIRFIHFSTDYVFDGNEGNYREDSIPNPINFYGLSKLLGDAYALSHDDSMVIRTSGVYGTSRNFPILVLEKLKNSEPVHTIKGYYSPIFVGLLAQSAVELMFSKHKGLLNIAGEKITRKEFAIGIAERFGLDKSLVKEDAEALNLVARRPFDSSLDSSRARELLSFDFYSSTANMDGFYSSLDGK